MSSQSQDIQGNLNVSRTINIGYNANIKGNATVDHNLVVKGWLDAPNIKNAFKGLFATESDLTRAYPAPMPGWFALVGDNLPAPIWKVTNGKWDNTGNSGGEFSIYLDNIENDINDLHNIDDEQMSLIAALQEAVWPLDLTLSVTPNVIEVGASTSLTARWTATRKGANILPSSSVDWISPAPATEMNKGASSKTFSMSPTSPGGTAVSVRITYDGMSKTISQQVQAVYPSYFGTVAASGDVTAVMVTGLTKQLNSTKSSSHTGISLSNQRLVYAYPKTFGALSSVKDGNNFETLTAYTRTEVTVGGVAYYVYAMTTPVTASGVMQTYA